MAKTSSVNRNDKRKAMVTRDKAKRAELKGRMMDRSTPVEERFEASMKLAEMPRNGAAVRVRLRCALTGRARGNYRKFHLSRNMLRALASAGQLPGVVKASW